MSEEEISFLGFKIKGTQSVKQLFGYLGWIVAVGAVVYSAWGPPSQIRVFQDRESQKSDEKFARLDKRLKAIERKLKIESPEELALTGPPKARP